MTPSLAYERKLYCSFCGKTAGEVRKLIAGPTVFICDECVALCQAIIAGEADEGAPNDLGKLSPAQDVAVRAIVTEMLATMFEGADGRIREAISTVAVTDILGRITGVANTTDHHPETVR